MRMSVANNQLRIVNRNWKNNEENSEYFIFNVEFMF
jgi:hypothetical protein